MTYADPHHLLQTPEPENLTNRTNFALQERLKIASINTVAEEKALQRSAMPMVAGGFLCLVDLAASIFAGYDPWTCLLRGGLAFAGGFFCTSVWYVMTVRTVIGSEEEEVEAEPVAVSEPAPTAPIPEATAPTETEAPAAEAA